MRRLRRPTPLILFGAFDRHNLGDLLFAHVAAALLPGRELIFAALAERDLTAWGGHKVEAIGRVAAQWEARCGDAPAHVVHVGGELLTCDAFEAAIMLMTPGEAGAAIAQHDADPQRLAWAQAALGADRRAAYVLPKRLFRRPGRFVFNGVGGVDLDRRDPALRAEVLDRLREADWIGVRDGSTRAILAGAGVPARLMPDPAVLVAELFAERIRTHGQAGEPAQVLRRFPRGYLAVQFSADLGDDATLAALVRGLAGARGFGLVFFRAGAAPWHDDLEVYRRAAARLPDAQVFASLDIWDICALIAGSGGFAGTSLHGRIVAQAFRVPVVEDIVPLRAKVRAYRDTWGDRDSVAVFRAAFEDWTAHL